MQAGEEPLPGPENVQKERPQIERDRVPARPVPSPCLAVLIQCEITGSASKLGLLPRPTTAREKRHAIAARFAPSRTNN